MRETNLIDLPEAAAQIGRSTDAIRRVLRKHPDLERRIVRRWGRRLLAPADIAAIRQAFAERDSVAK